MTNKPIYQCQCSNCLQLEYHPEKKEHAEINLFLGRLNEQQRRWYVAQEASKMGHGGIKRMSEITGMHVNTIRRGRRELDNGLADRPVNRVRVSGGGRPSIEKKEASTASTLKVLVENETGGDPMSKKKWIRRSLRNLSKDMQKQGCSASHETVRKLLKKHDYSLQSNRKSLASTSPPDRDTQFRYIKRIKKLFMTAGLPVISVDTKKKN